MESRNKEVHKRVDKAEIWQAEWTIVLYRFGHKERMHELCMAEKVMRQLVSGERLRDAHRSWMDALFVSSIGRQ